MPAHVIGYFHDVSSLLNIVPYFLFVFNKLKHFRTISAVGLLGFFGASLSVRLIFFLSHNFEFLEVDTSIFWI